MKIIHADAGSVIWAHGPIARATTPRWAVDDALRAITSERRPAGILHLLSHDQLQDLNRAMDEHADPFDVLGHYPLHAKEAHP